MPFYQVYHSCRLKKVQRQDFAAAITQLHCEAFTTPPFFVHVCFYQEHNGDDAYFVAGKSHQATSNRVIGNVRSSAPFSKADFDDLGAKIEAAWYDALKLSPPTEKALWKREDEARRLIMVTFLPMITTREGGMAIPDAGHEETWLKEHKPYFESMSNKGIENFSDLLSEIKGL
ncbi:hypothetical protein FSARC_12193 [Fusarium sarcochroum]|uniref:Tautomerase cis-CaaD-like domain-containing protein n=1 Tax=Fusarium sarcochroum TaxID=1208366 RepID=A0A8H4WYC8_9HYPO|nr:hypothetical protein FSARC_12193 [Fusarium sarcochroum]